MVALLAVIVIAVLTIVIVVVLMRRRQRKSEAENDGMANPFYDDGKAILTAHGSDSVILAPKVNFSDYHNFDSITQRSLLEVRHQRGGLLQSPNPQSSIPAEVTLSMR